jgi:hypothetical protein
VCPIAAAWLLAAVPAAHAQTQEPQLETAAPARLVFGPLSLAPHVIVRDVGIDTNVTNSSDQPTRDFTATVIPALDTRLRAGRTGLLSKSSYELLYFQKTASERSASFSQELRYDVPLVRVTPFVDVGRRVTHQRPNLEIDQRVQQTITYVGGGATARLGSRTLLTGELVDQQYAFPADGGDPSGLAAALNRRSRAADAEVDVTLTSLTTFLTRATVLRDRFDDLELRDNDSREMVAGFRFKPLALLSGTALVGVRDIRPRSSLVSGFTGVVANTTLAYVWRESTRVNALVSRTVDYSIEANQPYYVTFAKMVTLTRAIGLRWDVTGSAGQSRMTYQASLDNANRVDRQVDYRLGTGFHLTGDARIGFDTQYTRRLSALDARQYDGFRFGGSLTYAY